MQYEKVEASLEVQTGRAERLEDQGERLVLP